MDDNRITNEKVINNMAWRFGERMLAQLTTFIVSVVLARLLSASDFGNVALLMVFIDIANVFVVQGFASSLVQKKDADNRDFSSIFFFSLFISIIAYVLAYTLAPFLAIIGDDSLPALFRVLSLRIPLAAINSVQHSYVQRNLLFKKFFFMTLIGTVISAVIGIYMAFAGYGAWAIVGQYLTNSLCDTVVLWFTIGWRQLFVMDITRVKQLFGFGWKMLGSDLVHVIYGRLTTFFVGTMYSTQDLAYYEQGQKMPGILETNIDTTINSVLFPVMSAVQEDTDRIKQMIRRSIQISGSIICPMMVGLAVISDQIIALIYGEKWLPATVFMVIACFKMMIEPIQTSNLQAIKAIGRSDIYLKMEVIKKVVGIVFIIIGVRISVLATAIASALQFVFAALVNGVVNCHLFRYKVSEQLSDICTNIVLSFAMAMVVLLAKRLIWPSTVLKLLIEIIVGIVTYTLLLYLVNRKQFDLLMNVIKGFIKANS